MRKFLIRVNNNQYEVEVEEIRDDSVPTADSAVNTSKAADNTAHHSNVGAAKKEPVKAPVRENNGKTSSTGGNIGNVKITAPMPGTVLKVQVSIGTQVKKGQVLLLLEAMKMENEIAAPADGVISSINVAEGSSINAGDLLISMN
jgi:biotin carboxyl carrier protein